MPQGVRNALRSDAFAKNLDSFGVCRPSRERGRFPDEKQQGGACPTVSKRRQNTDGGETPGNDATTNEVPRGRQRPKQVVVERVVYSSSANCIRKLNRETSSLIGRICNPTAKSVGICNPAKYESQHYKCRYSLLSDYKSARTKMRRTMWNGRHRLVYQGPLCLFQRVITS